MPIATSPDPNHNVTAATTTSPLPPPQTFDILPLLYPILARLLPRDTSEASDPYTSLTPKELSTAAQIVMDKIRKARVAVRELPGIEMSLEDQQSVISELEEESRRLNRVLEGIGAKAREALGKMQDSTSIDAEVSTIEES